jgi:hypothetical protein
LRESRKVQMGEINLLSITSKIILPFTFFTMLWTSNFQSVAYLDVHVTVSDGIAGYVCHG